MKEKENTKINTSDEMNLFGEFVMRRWKLASGAKTKGN